MIKRTKNKQAMYSLKVYRGGYLILESLLSSAFYHDYSIHGKWGALQLHRVAIFSITLRSRNFRRPHAFRPSSGLPLAISLPMAQDAYGNKRIRLWRDHTPQSPAPAWCWTAEILDKMALNPVPVLGPSWGLFLGSILPGVDTASKLVYTSRSKGWPGDGCLLEAEVTGIMEL